MKKLIFIVFPLVLMLTGCEFLSAFMEDIDGEVYELPTSRFEIFPDKEEYFIGETIKINIAFEPDFDDIEKYYLLVTTEFTDIENIVKDTMKFSDGRITNRKEYIFDANTNLENSEIIKEIQIEFQKKGNYYLLINLCGRETISDDLYDKSIKKNITIREP